MVRDDDAAPELKPRYAVAALHLQASALVQVTLVRDDDACMQSYSTTTTSN